MEPAKKRNAYGEARDKQELKFEFDHQVFVVVCIFQNQVYIHVRRFKDRYPTKEGVAMSIEEWQKVSQQLTEDSDRKIITTTGKIMVRRNKNKSATLTSITKGSSISLTTLIVEDLRER